METFFKQLLYNACTYAEKDMDLLLAYPLSSPSLSQIYRLIQAAVLRNNETWKNIPLPQELLFLV